MRSLTLQDTKKRLERLEMLLDELVEMSEDVPVLVEGQRDLKALRNLGVDGDIICVHCGLTLLELCEAIAGQYEKVILMLDWDRKGRELSDRLHTNLLRLGVKVDLDLNSRIFGQVKKETKEVEGLDKLFRRLAKSHKRYRLDKFNRTMGFAQKRGRHP